MRLILKNSGISPAVGVILLIGITAAVATLAGIVLLDLGEGLNQTAQAGVEVNKTPSGVEVTWNTDSNAEKIIVQADGQEYTLNSVNDSLTLGLNKGSTISVIGVVDGEESVISNTTTESDTGNGTVKNYSPGNTSTVSGTVSVNPNIENATVRVVKNDTLINTTTTDSSGSYSVNAPEESRLEVIVEGFTYDSGSKTLYGSTVQDLGSDFSSGVDIQFTEPGSTVSVNNSDILVANESYNGMKTIGSVEQLQAIKTDLSGEYMLLSDIDASDTSSWNSGKGFKPIGDSFDSFKGSIDGNGHTISNLYIDRPSGENVGIIGYTYNSVSIEDISIQGVDITGSENVGGFIGYTSSSFTGNNITVEGNVKADTGSSGGVIGYANGSSIQNFYFNGTVENTGDSGFIHIGGLVGQAYQTPVVDSHAKSTVKNTSGSIDSIGGLVGYSNSTITSSYSEGTVKNTSTKEAEYIGGLAAQSSEVSNSHSTSNVINNVGGDEVGGLVGYASGEITNSYTTGTVTNNGSGETGGLVGYASMSVKDSYATGDVTNSSGDTGGLVGYSSTVSKSYATGDVTNSSGDTGGLVGYSSGNVINSYATGIVTNNGSGDTGGLVGYSSTVSKSYATGDVTNSSGDTGGLVGYDGGSITNSYYYKSPNNGVGTQLAESEMKGESVKSNLTGFDFSSVWKTTDEYPELQG